MTRPVCIAAGLALAVWAGSCGRGTADPLPGFPRLMLWAWERPEDLRFLNREEAGVAFLAGTVTVDRERWTLRPRLQPLLVEPGTRLMAVVRVEPAPGSRAEMAAAEGIAGAAAGLAGLPGVGAMQIDFDARESERGFYRAMVGALRERLPASMPLTITALASWCVGDRWMEGMPVAEATPMYFRMGPEPYLRGAAVRSPLCGSSTGLATDELVRVPVRGRVFLFHPRPWTREAVRAAVAEVRRW